MTALKRKSPPRWELTRRLNETPLSQHISYLLAKEGKSTGAGLVLGTLANEALADPSLDPAWAAGAIQRMALMEEDPEAMYEQMAANLLHDLLKAKTLAEAMRPVQEWVSGETTDNPVAS
jgi:hypothetical protein